MVICNINVIISMLRKVKGLWHGMILIWVLIGEFRQMRLFCLRKINTMKDYEMFLGCLNNENSLCTRKSYNAYKLYSKYLQKPLDFK